MAELITNYSWSEIILFVIAFAAAIKGVVTFWDWGKDRLRKVYDKEDKIEEIKSLIVENPAMYQGRLIKANLHCVIRKAFWGKESRNICKAFLDFMDKYFAPLKLTAFVPQCGYGIIKLLKDMGFIHEGTMKKSRLYLDKNNEPKLYDELIYSRNRME